MRDDAKDTNTATPITNDELEALRRRNSQIERGPWAQVLFSQALFAAYPGLLARIVQTETNMAEALGLGKDATPEEILGAIGVLKEQAKMFWDLAEKLVCPPRKKEDLGFLAPEVALSESVATITALQHTAKDAKDLDRVLENHVHTLVFQWPSGGFLHLERRKAGEDRWLIRAVNGRMGQGLVMARDGLWVGDVPELADMRSFGFSEAMMRLRILGAVML